MKVPNRKFAGCLPRPVFATGPDGKPTNLRTRNCEASPVTVTKLGAVPFGPSI
jgi:hypothetical protein